MVCWSFAVLPTIGQFATSFLAMKAIGQIAPITRMSSHETWLDRISVGRPCDGTPATWIRTRSSRVSAR